MQRRGRVAEEVGPQLRTPLPSRPDTQGRSP